MELCDLTSFSTVLFPVIYSLRPQKDAPRVARLLLMQKSVRELDALIEKIEKELRQPSCEIRHTLPLACDPPEEDVREFLRLVVVHLRGSLNALETKTLSARA
ncbi:MAG: hypothetical protein M5U26_27240 [Planctomycetota bacterium]|nr:hypothetical protein [Planctomycetota bacterium]